jgi:hypothetical protein
MTLMYIFSRGGQFRNFEISEQLLFEDSELRKCTSKLLIDFLSSMTTQYTQSCVIALNQCHKHTLSVLRIFVYYHSLSASFNSAHNFFREIATFIPRLLSYNNFIFNHYQSFYSIFLFIFKMRLTAPECIKVCLELDLEF